MLKESEEEKQYRKDNEELDNLLKGKSFSDLNEEELKLLEDLTTRIRIFEEKYYE